MTPSVVDQGGQICPSGGLALCFPLFYSTSLLWSVGGINSSEFQGCVNLCDRRKVLAHFVTSGTFGAN